MNPSQFISKPAGIHVKKHLISYFPTHLSHLSFPSLHRPLKPEAICSYDLENNFLEIPKKNKKQLREEKIINNNFNEYIRLKLASSSMDSILDSKETTLEQIHSKNTSIRSKKTKKSIIFLPYLHIKQSPSKESENTIEIKDNERDLMKLPSFITERTLENENKLNKEIIKRKKKINSFASTIKKIEEKKKKHKIKKPYSKNHDELIKDAHYAVFEIENDKNNMKKIEGTHNNLKNFTNRHRTSENKLELNERKEVRFPLLFQKVLASFKEIKRPDNNFQLFSQIPANKLLMKNVNQTLRIRKTQF